jgi:hypothetical protein
MMDIKEIKKCKRETERTIQKSIVKPGCILQM